VGIKRFEAKSRDLKERKTKLNVYNEDGVAPREYRVKTYKNPRFDKTTSFPPNHLHHLHDTTQFK